MSAGHAGCPGLAFMILPGVDLRVPGQYPTLASCAGSAAGHPSSTSIVPVVGASISAARFSKVLTCGTRMGVRTGTWRDDESIVTRESARRRRGSPLGDLGLGAS